jgi:hypothetical protein
MKAGSIVTYKYFENIKKINDIGIILEIQRDFLILKEILGFTYEDLLRVHWFTKGSEGRVPAFKTDYHQRKWYLQKTICTINQEMEYGNF